MMATVEDVKIAALVLALQRRYIDDGKHAQNKEAEIDNAAEDTPGSQKSANVQAQKVPEAFLRQTEPGGVEV